MQKKNPIIRILPHNRLVKAESGRTILEALIHHGIFLRSDCGGNGICGKCRVQKKMVDDTEEIIESCTYRVDADMSIEIPVSSMLSSHIMTKAPVSFPVTFIDKFKQSIELDGYGIAVDLGTTTIAVYLCDMDRGEVISSVAVKNPQAIYGDDVMSRIGVIGQDSDKLKKLQTLAVKSIEWGMKTLVSRFNDTPVSISRMTIVGNPAMIHILVGVDPKPIGISPYLPAFYDADRFKPKNLGFDDLTCRIQTLPQVSGFIGGDILAAALAVDIHNQPVGTLLVDLGTNGELLLKGEDRFYATSCATGPAFEGASLSCGMQAIPGAVNAVTIDDNGKVSEFSIINPDHALEIHPAGICGAGVINVVAQLCDKKIVAPDGRFTAQDGQFILVPANPDQAQPAIYISQKDIRSVQLGKSALISGIEFLLKRAGFKTPVKIIIAGAFGSHLNKTDLIRLGIIPNIDPEKIEMVGNAAGAGAVMTLCDKTYVDRTNQMVDKIYIVDLATDIKFQEIFVTNLNFPEQYE